MQILEGLAGLRSIPPASVISIGNFDGVHRGHAQILQTAKSLAVAQGNAKLAVVTFEPHPLTVLRPEIAPPRLTAAERKEELLAQAGVDYLAVLPPEPSVLNLRAEEFWAILRDEVRPTHLVEGGLFNFGKDRGGTIPKLREWTATSSVKLTVIEPVRVALLDLSVVSVSSSLIRWLLGHGRVRDAAICLGRPFELEGEVVRGKQRGKGIGVPTANLDGASQLIPADGVYTGRCRVGELNYAAAISIGTMPTFGNNARQVEVHLIGFDGDLYGQRLRVQMTDWVREQRKFAGIQSLKAQLAHDIAVSVERSEADPSRAVATV